MDSKVRAHVAAALECSVYVSPRDYGLTEEEIVEIGRRLGFKEGETRDAIATTAAPMDAVGARRKPRAKALWADFLTPSDPEYRNVSAFEFVCQELRESIRSEGKAAAGVSYGVLVERAIATGIPQLDVEAAIAILLLSERIDETSRGLRFRPGKESYALPTEQAKNSQGRASPNEVLRSVFPIVQDVIRRRSDGRPPYAEPLDAFRSALSSLGYANFGMWWVQTVAELRRLEPATCPVAAAVLSAALVEGALTFVVKHANDRGVGTLGSKSFAGDPRTWKIDDLVASAARGAESAILDDGTRKRAEALIKVRQRIHAGRMLSDFPTGVPDLRPEEAREARMTVDVVVRQVLDWLDRYPPPTK